MFCFVWRFEQVKSIISHRKLQNEGMVGTWSDSLGSERPDAAPKNAQAARSGRGPC